MAEEQEDYAVRAAREWQAENDYCDAYNGCSCYGCVCSRKEFAERTEKLAAIIRKHAAADIKPEHMSVAQMLDVLAGRPMRSRY